MENPIADRFRRALVEAGWEIDMQRFAAILARGGTILASEEAFYYLYATFFGPMPPGATRFAIAGVEVRLSKYLERGQLAAIAAPADWRAAEWIVGKLTPE